MTPNKEDYLKCIYEIGMDVPKITNKEIAARMQVSPPAVTEMIKRMQSENLILKDKKKGYLLTCLLYTSPSPRDRSVSRMPSSA